MPLIVLATLLAAGSVHAAPGDAAAQGRDEGASETRAEAETNEPDAADQEQSSNGDEPEANELAERLARLRRQLVTAEGLELEEARRELERLAERHGLETMGEHLESWQHHGRQVIRRAAVQVLLGLEAHDAVRPHLARFTEAGAPEGEVAEAEFVRLTTGVPADARGERFRDRDGSPEPPARYGWLVEQRTDPRTGEAVFGLLTADWRRYEYRRAANAPAGAPPRIEPASFERTARHWIGEAHAERVPAFEPLYAAMRLLPRPSYGEPQARQRVQRLRFVELLLLIAVNAELRGHKILAGEAVEAALTLWWRIQQQEQEQDAEEDTPAPGQPMLEELPEAFVELGALAVSRALYRHVLEDFSLGVIEPRETKKALQTLRDKLFVEPVSFHLDDLVEAFDRRTAHEMPDQAPPVRSDTAPEQRKEAARWHAERLLELKLELETGPLEEALGLFDEPEPPVRTLLELNVHAIPALLERLDDRRPSRVLLPSLDGIPVPVRLGDLCWHILRRITGESLTPSGFVAGPVPSLDEHEAVLAAHAREWWEEAAYRGDETAFLEQRMAETENPDRLRHIDRYRMIAPLEALERMKQIAEQSTELEPRLITRLLRAARLGETRSGKQIPSETHERLTSFFTERLQATTDAQTRLRLARHLDLYHGDVRGAELVFADLEAGELQPESYEELATLLDWLREAATREPGLIPEWQRRLGDLATGSRWPARAQLDLLRYLAAATPSEERLPLAWRAALVTRLHDRRVVGAHESREEVAETERGMVAPRWRDHAAALLAEQLDDPVPVEFDADLVERDRAAQRVARRLQEASRLGWPPSEEELAELASDAQTDPQAVMEAFAARAPLLLAEPAQEAEEAAEEGVPEHERVERRDAQRRLEALLRAPSRETAQRAHQRALELGPGLYSFAAQRLRDAHGEQRQRLEQLCADLANVCRRVRLYAYRESANHNGAHGPAAPALDEPTLQAAGEALLESFGTWHDEPLSSAMLREVFRALHDKFDRRFEVETAEGDVRTVRLVRVDLLLCRLERGRGSVAEVAVTFAAAPSSPEQEEATEEDEAPPAHWMRLGVAVEGNLRASRGVATRSLDVLEYFLGEAFEQYDRALKGLEERVEARLTLTRQQR